MLLVRVFLLALLTSLISSPALSNFDITGETDYSNLLVAPDGSGKAWVSLRSNGGVTGSEFRLQGIPEGWTVVAVPNPVAAVVLGDPTSVVGANINFSSCQGQGDVLLYELTIFPNSHQGDWMLEIVARNPPTNPYFACPTSILCDMPVFSSRCERVASLCVSSIAYPGCGTAVEGKTWSEVKDLYK